MALKFEWTRIKNDGNGNPRYVVHFLALCTQYEKNSQDWDIVGGKYNAALARAKRIGGRKFHNKQYGGGIVFQSYNLEKIEAAIALILGE